jgi:hypothetical protein
MMSALREMVHSLRASPGFALALLITPAAAGFNRLMIGLMALRLDLPPWAIRPNDALHGATPPRPRPHVRVPLRAGP